MSQTIAPQMIRVNFSPLAFRLYAKHYYKCKQDFKCPDKFSPIPYFLLCRSIELSIKARHLKQVGQKDVKLNLEKIKRKHYLGLYKVAWIKNLDLIV